MIFLTDRKLDRYCIGTQSILHHLHTPKKVRTHNVHFIDMGNTRYSIFIGLSPYGFRLGLNTALRTEERDRSVEHAQGTFNFNCEVNMSRCVYNVNTAMFPLSGGSSGSNGDSSFLFLLHPVHCGSAFMNFTDLVGTTSIEQNSFRGGCFTCVDVCHNTDVSCVFQAEFSGHRYPPFDVIVHCLLRLKLPPVVCKSLVGLCHLMGVILFLHGCSQTIGCIHDLTGKSF